VAYGKAHAEPSPRRIHRIRQGLQGMDRPRGRLRPNESPLSRANHGRFRNKNELFGLLDVAAPLEDAGYFVHACGQRARGGYIAAS
jgi:hypothetical protein